jgi:alpha-glucosidase
MRFWLDRGVDGFRVDVIWHLIKDDQFRSNPPNPDYRPGEWPYRQLLATYTTDRPEVHEIIGGMRAVVDEYDDRLLIGEIYLPVDRLVTYYGTGAGGVHLPFNFQLVEIAWHARTIAATIESYEAALPSHGWPNWVLGNHDKSRIATRVGQAQARNAAMLLLTLRGTPTLYYGDEIGMSDVPIPADLVQDPWEKNLPGLGLGRDPARTPMQWDDSAQAGFTTGIPWLPISPQSLTVNMAAQRTAPASMLTLYRRLIQLRRKELALTLGAYKAGTTTDDLMVYSRELANSRLLVALNFSHQPQTVTFTPDQTRGKILLSTNLDREGERFEQRLHLHGDEGVIAKLR